MCLDSIFMLDFHALLIWYLIKINETFFPQAVSFFRDISQEGISQLVNSPLIN